MVGGSKIITTYIYSYKKNLHVLKYNDLFYFWNGTYIYKKVSRLLYRNSYPIKSLNVFYIIWEQDQYESNI